MVTNYYGMFHLVFPFIPYLAVVLQDLWCWKNKSLDIVIQDSDVDSIQFIQSGYVLKCSLTHNITLVSK